MGVIFDKILGVLRETDPASSATGDVVGPSSAVSGNIVLFDGTTGKLVKDGLIALSALQAVSEKGSAGGYAELDLGGKVPASQLPSYVDDVVEAANFAALPVTGETGKIYVTLDDNKTYRWSGSAYVEISASLALGTTSSTAFRGDFGNTAYSHSQLTSGNPHNVTASDVGLGNLSVLNTLGSALQQIRVNAGGTAFEFFTPAASGLSWGTSVNGATGTGLALAMDNSYAASGIGQSITIGNTQTNALTALKIDTGTSTPYHFGFEVISKQGEGIRLNKFGSATQAVASGYAFTAWPNFNTSSTFSPILMVLQNENNAWTGRNTGFWLRNYSTEFVVWASAAWVWFQVTQSWAAGTSIAVYGDDNVNSSTNGLVNYTLSNTQSWASVMQKIELGSSAQAHTGLSILMNNASSTAKWIYLNLSSSWTWNAIDVAMWTGNKNEQTGWILFSWSFIQGTMLASTASFSETTNTDGSLGHNVMGFRVTRNFATSATNRQQYIPVYQMEFSRTGTTTSGTVTDSYNMAQFKRTNVQNGTWGTHVTSWSVVSIENVSTQTAGTLTDSVAVLKLTQDNDSTGGHILFNSYSGTPTTDGTFWFNGTDLKLRAGGVTYTITKA